MSYVSFPGLGLELNIQRIAFSVGNIAIHWYAILILIAIGIAMWGYKKNDGKFGIKFSDILDLSLYAIPIAIISTRIYYILFNLNTYIANPMQIFNFRSRRIGHIWGHYRWIYYMLHILQKKKN